MFEASRAKSSLAFLGFGVSTFIDAEVSQHDLRGEKSFTQLDLTFNLNAPIPGFAPGISFGVLDAADQSPEGVRGYFAASFQEAGGVGEFGGNATVEATVGAVVGRESHAFVGMSLPTTEHFRFLAEHDGFRISAGAEYKMSQGPFFRLVFRESQTLLSAGMTAHF